MKPTRRALPALLLTPAAAAAQGAPPAPPRRGPHGGQVTIADGHPIELVATGTTLTLYLNGEDGRPLPSARASGRVTMQAGGRVATVDLGPAEPNRLVGTLEGPLAAGTRIVFSGMLGDGHRVTARFLVE